ncbi:MAG: AMP-binding protein, partial [Bacteroidota bacterium]
MYNEKTLTLPHLFGQAVGKYGDKGSLGFAGEAPMTFETVHGKVYATVAFLENLGIKPGDRVAILSMNMPAWGITYMAATFMGAVAVPLLPDFHPTEIGNILEHSGARLMFVSKGLRNKAEGSSMAQLEYMVAMEDFSLLKGGEAGTEFDPKKTPATDYQVKEDDTAAIIYTSGTTGKS